ncbi:hypothetical protein BH10PLA2_BH10PLA2_39740 [soil metagenome]
MCGYTRLPLLLVLPEWNLGAWHVSSVPSWGNGVHCVEYTSYSELPPRDQWLRGVPDEHQLHLPHGVRLLHPPHALRFPLGKGRRLFPALVPESSLLMQGVDERFLQIALVHRPG